MSTIYLLSLHIDSSAVTDGLSADKGSLEKGTAIHSSILGWRIPWTEEPVRLQLMGSQRVGHWATNITGRRNIGRSLFKEVWGGVCGWTYDRRHKWRCLYPCQYSPESLCLERKRLWITTSFQRFTFHFILNLLFSKDSPGGSDDKESACNAGDPGSIPGLGRSPWEGNGNPL